MEMKKLRKLVPFVKEYSEGVGTHVHQPLIITDKSKRTYGDSLWLGNAVVAYISRDGIVRNGRNFTYCTGSFFSGYHSNNRNDILIQIQDRFPDLDEDAYRNYIAWVIKYSPWADAFISKNINTVLRRKIAVIDGSKPRWYKKEATIAIRMAWENYYNSDTYHSVSLWWDLAKEVNPDLSFLAGMVVAAPKRDERNTIILTSARSGHFPINYSASSPNLNFDGWFNREMIQGGWSEKGRGNIIGQVKNLVQNINSDKHKVNPFGDNLTKSWKREDFIKSLRESLPKLETNNA